MQKSLCEYTIKFVLVLLFNGEILEIDKKKLFERNYKPKTIPSNDEPTNNAYFFLF